MKRTTIKDVPFKVHMGFKNYTGEINDDTVIAAFRSESWAKDFVTRLMESKSYQEDENMVVWIEE